MTQRMNTSLIPAAVALIGLVGSLVLEASAATIVVYGASGQVGSVIVNEALSRGHDVIGVSRHPDSLTNNHSKFSAVAGDATQLASMLEPMWSSYQCAVLDLATHRTTPSQASPQELSCKRPRNLVTRHRM
jgi:NADPH:quinone reductase-like Zn-dependent oxidoreductase